MRLGLNKEQWDKILSCTDKITSMPATVGNFLQYFTEYKTHGNFNIAYDPKREVFGVWYDNNLDKYEDKELINAMFNLFCSMEEI